MGSSAFDCCVLVVVAVDDDVAVALAVRLVVALFDCGAGMTTVGSSALLTEHIEERGGEEGLTFSGAWITIVSDSESELSGVAATAEAMTVGSSAALKNDDDGRLSPLLTTTVSALGETTETTLALAGNVCDDVVVVIVGITTVGSMLMDRLNSRDLSATAEVSWMLVLTTAVVGEVTTTADIVVVVVVVIVGVDFVGGIMSSDEDVEEEEPLVALSIHLRASSVCCSDITLR